MAGASTEGFPQVTLRGRRQISGARDAVEEGDNDEDGQELWGALG